jgi:hypothetical protein
MPKSRRGKGKHPHYYSKKSKALRRQGTPGTAPPAVSQTTAAAPETARQAAPVAAVPAPKAASSAAKVAVNPYPFLANELRRIAILGAIIVVVLVVLTFVLK